MVFKTNKKLNTKANKGFLFIRIIFTRLSSPFRLEPIYYLILQALPVMNIFKLVESMPCLVYFFFLIDSPKPGTKQC